MPLPRAYINNRSFRGASGALHRPSAIIHDSWVNPAASDDNGISVSHAGASAAGTRNQTLGGALCSGGVATFDYAKNVVIVVTHASSVVAMSGTIYGTDINGDDQTEAWSVSATGTSKTFTGKKAFKTVTRITETIAATAAANTIISGTGEVLGLSTLCSVASAVKEFVGGSVVTNGTIVAGSTVSTADPRGTYSPNTVTDGSTDYDVWFISDLPENDRGLA